MRRLRGAAVVATLAVALAAAPSRVAAEGLPSSEVYARRRVDIPGAVGWLASEAKRIDAKQVLVVFDVATFAPPPGHTEFTAQYAFFRDLDPWLRAFEGWATSAGAPTVRGTSSLAPKTIEMTGPRSRATLAELVRRPWWKDDAIQEIEPAVRWMTRLLDRTALPLGSTATPPRRMVVLVSGGLTPERWVPVTPSQRGYESEWRTKLLPIGRYWDPEAVGALLSERGGTLYAVAPEARFGDATPFVEAPDVPWASRPQFPSLGRRRWGDPPATGGLLRGGIEDALRGVTDPEARRRLLEEVTRRATAPSLREPANPVGRFASTTPAWFETFSGVRLWTDDAPSGYGSWPLARSVARTRGRYLFYPLPASQWLDACPADPTLLDRLAPELVTPGRYLALRGRDRALDALCRAAALVVKDTPWADSSFGHRAASGWSALARAAPLVMQPDSFLRRRPFDLGLSASEEDMRRRGEEIAKDVLPRYDEALALLDGAIADVEADRSVRSHPRSVANLHLARFRFAMSAFHLEAFSIYAREVERFVPESMRGHVHYVHVAYVPTIRMSDCLDAYDGRTLPVTLEGRYPRWLPADASGYQGNLLEIPKDDPNYRAKRGLEPVLRHLDPRLRRRAMDMIQSAKAVMRGHARSGFGWTTYYSDAFTFVFTAVEVERGSRPATGESTRQPPRPTTPQGPGSGGGGSTSPSGPTTPGR
jgi:hypothetical protein